MWGINMYGRYYFMYFLKLQRIRLHVKKKIIVTYIPTSIWSILTKLHFLKLNRKHSLISARGGQLYWWSESGDTIFLCSLQYSYYNTWQTVALCQVNIMTMKKQIPRDLDLGTTASFWRGMWPAAITYQNGLLRCWNRRALP